MLVSSPRPWGCFYGAWIFSHTSIVFPTPVGVFPLRGDTAATQLRLPHARGGVSQKQKARVIGLLSSPRPWGCFLSERNIKIIISVFPTPVGVFPGIISLRPFILSLPHARGGVS